MAGGKQVEAPYGTWKSPITPDDFAATGSVVLDQPCVNVGDTSKDKSGHVCD